MSIMGGNISFFLNNYNAGSIDVLADAIGSIGPGQQR